MQHSWPSGARPWKTQLPKENRRTGSAKDTGKHESAEAKKGGEVQGGARL